MILLLCLLVFVAPGVQATSHLSFSNITEVTITRSGCGMSKLCVETPVGCDPATNGSCLFSSLVAGVPMPPNGSYLTVELRGESAGYIALGLTDNATVGTTMLFICAQNQTNNGSFFFRTMDRDNVNNTLTPTERRTKEIRGVVTGDVIRCAFVIPNVNASMTRNAADTTFVVLLGSGPVNGNSIGSFNVNLTSSRLNVADPTANVPTTAMPMTTNSSSTAVHPHAALLLLGVLTLPVVLNV